MRAREQDIRRDKAASNICTNQALLALAAPIYLATIGPHGLRDVAALGASRAAELEAALAAVGAERMHPGPYLNEFVVRVPDARTVHRRLLEAGILAGLVLADAEPGRPGPGRRPAGLRHGGHDPGRDQRLRRGLWPRSSAMPTSPVRRSSA